MKRIVISKNIPHQAVRFEAESDDIAESETRMKIRL